MVRKLLGLFASIVVPGIILGLGAYFTQKLFNLQISPNYTITSKIGEPVLLVQRFFTLCIGTAMICCGWWSLAVLYWVATHFLASLFLWKFLAYNWKTYTYCGSRQLIIQCQGWGNLSSFPWSSILCVGFAGNTSPSFSNFSLLHLAAYCEWASLSVTMVGQLFTDRLSTTFWLSAFFLYHLVGRGRKGEFDERNASKKCFHSCK